VKMQRSHIGPPCNLRDVNVSCLLSHRCKQIKHPLLYLIPLAPKSKDIWHFMSVYLGLEVKHSNIPLCYLPVACFLPVGFHCLVFQLADISNPLYIQLYFEFSVYGVIVH
jgi:hypothetical protein